MPDVVQWLDETFYPDYEDNWDDKLFADWIERRIDEESVVLDLGAGAGLVEEMNFKGRAERVCGVDLDERVLENPYLDEAKLGRGEEIPYDDDTFDVVFSDNVLEHLDHPREVFREVARVLEPGGWYLVKTPNKYHYMPAVAASTPQWFHDLYNKLRGRDPGDTFPTRYRANTPEALRRLAGDAGMRLESVSLVEGRPEYLRISPLTYPVGVAYERLVNSIDTFSKFRVLLVGEMRLET